MKILDKYILKFYLSRFIAVFAICFLIFIIQTFWLYIDELAGKGLDIFTIGNDWEGKFDDLKSLCTVKYISRTPDISSTNLKADIKNN